MLHPVSCILHFKSNILYPAFLFQYICNRDFDPTLYRRPLSRLFRESSFSGRCSRSNRTRVFLHDREEKDEKERRIPQVILRRDFQLHLKVRSQIERSKRRVGRAKETAHTSHPTFRSALPPFYCDRRESVCLRGRGKLGRHVPESFVDDVPIA